MTIQKRGHNEVPVAHQFTGLAAFQVVGLPRSQLTQWVKVSIINHQRLGMPLKVVADFCRRRAVAQEFDVLDDQVQVEVLDGFEAPPCLFPSAAEFRPVQHVHQRSLQRCDANVDAGPLDDLRGELLLSLLPKRLGEEHALEAVGSKCRWSKRLVALEKEPFEHGMSLPMNLQSGVVGKHRVVGGLCRDEIGVDRKSFRIASMRNNRIEPPANLEDVALLAVVGKQALSRPVALVVFLGAELFRAEHGMTRKEVVQTHV